VKVLGFKNKIMADKIVIESVKTKVNIQIEFDCHNVYNYSKSKISKLISQYSLSELKDNKVLMWKDDEYNFECIILDKVIVNKIKIQ